HLEIGAMVTVKKLLMIGRHVVPSALFEALQQVAPAGIKNLATLGGNICVADRNMTTAPVLQLMDAALELRRHGATRWVAASRFRLPDGSLDLRGGDVLTRIRVPLDSWNIQYFRRFGTEYSPETNPLSFCGLARIDKSIVEDARIAFCSSTPGLIRDREIEAEIVGRKLPISERDAAAIIARYADAIGASVVKLDGFQHKRALRLVGWFLNRLSDE
ncbi:MAG TPA: FAD binding domain-containing protein, partial [Spirochaetia bacterium]|nr:FAD binding domain-containing protein [Spirochaetia bacterium]